MPLTREQQIDLAWQQHGAIKQAWQPLPAPQKLTPQIRDRLAEAQNWRCCYCGRRMMGHRGKPDAATFEHITPVAMGGTDSIDNIAIACKRCNEDRGVKRYWP